MSDDQFARAGRTRLAGCEAHYGQPQDTEWAIDRDGALWLTQARPVTTLFPLPDVGATDDELRVYFCFSLAQGLTRPLTPMGISAFRVIGLLRRPPVRPSAGRSAGRATPGPRRGRAALLRHHDDHAQHPWAGPCSPGCST